MLIWGPIGFPVSKTAKGWEGPQAKAAPVLPKKGRRPVSGNLNPKNPNHLHSNASDWKRDSSGIQEGSTRPCPGPSARNQLPARPVLQPSSGQLSDRRPPPPPDRTQAGGKRPSRAGLPWSYGCAPSPGDVCRQPASQAYHKAREPRQRRRPGPNRSYLSRPQPPPVGPPPAASTAQAQPASAVS